MLRIILRARILIICRVSSMKRRWNSRWRLAVVALWVKTYYSCWIGKLICKTSAINWAQKQKRVHLLPWMSSLVWCTSKWLRLHRYCISNYGARLNLRVMILRIKSRRCIRNYMGRSYWYWIGLINLTQIGLMKWLRKMVQAFLYCYQYHKIKMKVWL